MEISGKFCNFKQEKGQIPQLSQDELAASQARGVRGCMHVRVLVCVHVCVRACVQEDSKQLPQPWCPLSVCCVFHLPSYLPLTFSSHQ